MLVEHFGEIIEAYPKVTPFANVTRDAACRIEILSAGNVRSLGEVLNAQDAR